MQTDMRSDVTRSLSLRPTWEPSNGRLTPTPSLSLPMATGREGRSASSTTGSYGAPAPPAATVSVVSCGAEGASDRRSARMAGSSALLVASSCSTTQAYSCRKESLISAREAAAPAEAEAAAGSAVGSTTDATAGAAGGAASGAGGAGEATTGNNHATTSTDAGAPPSPRPLPELAPLGGAGVEVETTHPAMAMEGAVSASGGGLLGGEGMGDSFQMLVEDPSTLAESLFLPGWIFHIAEVSKLNPHVSAEVTEDLQPTSCILAPCLWWMRLCRRRSPAPSAAQSDSGRTSPRRPPPRARGCCTRADLKVRRAEHECFNDIKISTRMFSDHMPGNYWKRAQELNFCLGAERNSKKAPPSEIRRRLESALDYFQALSTIQAYHRTQTSPTRSPPPFDTDEERETHSD
mmetsp:Transcript_27281/g.78464  ORF Transcript_27281/g.78464 Transcript_27281/m.78464 type:complete len:406 (+) Transcript_27281:330-1547(+)